MGLIDVYSWNSFLTQVPMVVLIMSFLDQVSWRSWIPDFFCFFCSQTTQVHGGSRSLSVPPHIVLQSLSCAQGCSNPAPALPWVLMASPPPLSATAFPLCWRKQKSLLSKGSSKGVQLHLVPHKQDFLPDICTLLKNYLAFFFLFFCSSM